MVKESLAEFIVGWFIVRIGQIGIGFFVIVLINCQNIVADHTFRRIIRHVFLFILTGKEQGQRNDDQYPNANQNANEETVLFHN